MNKTLDEYIFLNILPVLNFCHLKLKKILLCLLRIIVTLNTIQSCRRMTVMDSIKMS